MTFPLGRRAAVEADVKVLREKRLRRRGKYLVQVDGFLMDVTCGGFFGRLGFWGKWCDIFDGFWMDFGGKSGRNAQKGDFLDGFWMDLVVLITFFLGLKVILRLCLFQNLNGSCLWSLVRQIAAHGQVSFRVHRLYPPSTHSHYGS